MSVERDRKELIEIANLFRAFDEDLEDPREIQEFIHDLILADRARRAPVVAAPAVGERARIAEALLVAAVRGVPGRLAEVTVNNAFACAEAFIYEAARGGGA